MSLVNTVYRTLFKRTSTFLFTMVVGVFAFERFVDGGGDYLFERYNQGKLWNHIKQNYETKDED